MPNSYLGPILTIAFWIVTPSARSSGPNGRLTGADRDQTGKANGWPRVSRNPSSLKKPPAVWSLAGARRGTRATCRLTFGGGSAPNELERWFPDPLTRLYPGRSPAPGRPAAARFPDITGGLEPPIRVLV